MGRNPVIHRMGACLAHCWLRRAQPVPVLKPVLMLAAVLLVLVKVGAEPPQWLLQGTDSVAVLVAACVVYALLLAIPFVPSVEIGLLIMVLFGVPGALGAYLATCTGLMMAYAIGGRLGSGTRRLQQFHRAGSRLHRLSAHLPAGALPVLSLVMLLNMPGNTAVGGGGGIAMAYGAGRLLTWRVYLATVGVGTGLLPLAFVTGLVGMEQFAGWTGRG